MRVPALMVVALCLAIPAFSQDGANATDTVVLSSELKPGDLSRYNIKVQVAGKAKVPDAAEPISVDASLELVVLHRVGQRAADGSFELTITAERASAVIAGQKMDLPQDTYPRMTAMFDKNGELLRLLGADPKRALLPGINYWNLILLFNPHAPPGELKPGATWKKTLKIPSQPEKYEFCSKLEAVEDVNGLRTARVRSDVAVLPPPGEEYTAKGFVATNFSVDGGKLVTSHIEMTVTMPDGSVRISEIDPADAPLGLSSKVQIDIKRITAE